jgi:hypothetical protein
VAYFAARAADEASPEPNERLPVGLTPFLLERTRQSLWLAGPLSLVGHSAEPQVALQVESSFQQTYNGFCRFHRLTTASVLAAGPTAAWA